MKLNALRSQICSRLQIKNFRFVEIESKNRVAPQSAKGLRKYLLFHKNVKHVKATSFFDQFLDTPHLDLMRLGASLRIRYKGNGDRIYLQYKGPGFHEDNVLFRSEFSSENLEDLILEESHHDMIRFNQASLKRIMSRYARKPMVEAMKTQLGAKVINNISYAPVISLYKKDKFKMNLGEAFLEPSLDRVFAFHISQKGLHPLSTFWEMENEIKASGKSLDAKMKFIPEMKEFDAMVAERFDLAPEPLDKYHRCGSIFLEKKKRTSAQPAKRKHPKKKK